MNRIRMFFFPICFLILFSQYYSDPISACSPPPGPPWFTAVFKIEPDVLPGVSFLYLVQYQAGDGNVGILRISNHSNIPLDLVQQVSSPATPTATQVAWSVLPILSITDSMSTVNLQEQDLARFIPNMQRQRFGWTDRPRNITLPPPQQLQLKFEYNHKTILVPFEFSYILNNEYEKEAKKYQCPEVAFVYPNQCLGLGLLVIFIVAVIWLTPKAISQRPNG